MESSTCRYCNSLKQAIAGNNFCSKNGDDINFVNSNAFYFNSNYLYSGEHVSRLTLRSINQGYQYHNVDDREYMVDKDKYLIVNEGQPYRSEIQSNHPIDGLVIAFNPEYLRQVHHAMFYSLRESLDNPFESGNSFFFKQQCFDISVPVKSTLNKLRTAILDGYKDQVYFDELFHQLMTLMLADYKQELSKIDLINVKNVSTKSEIHKRLHLAKEYIDVYHDQNLSLNTIAQVATLSSFHFLRLFKEYYGASPYQYILKQRLKKAAFLLKDSNLSITTICHNVGYENHSSFSRLFKSMFLQTPQQYRTSLSLA